MGSRLSFSLFLLRQPPRPLRDNRLDLRRLPLGVVGRRLPMAGMLLVAFVLLGAGLALAALTGAAVYAPPATGAFPYNSFIPVLTPGVSYVDPVFG
jgi:hypothetical protein